jgi:CheY-like chemotaxis protein
MLLNAIDILLVEDNPGDIRLTREALRDSKIWQWLKTA